MRRLAFVIIACVALVAAAQSLAAAPGVVIEQVDRTRTVPAGGLGGFDGVLPPGGTRWARAQRNGVCDVDVVLHSEGTSRTTTYTNVDGSLDRFTIHLSHWKTSITNPANGASIRTVLAGAVIVEAEDDSSALLRV